MKLHYFFITWFILAILLIPFFAEPCSAAFSPSNNVTLERDGMTWGYKEISTENEAVFFREFIDLQKGNHDDFVNAWEILKSEMFLRDKMEESIKNKPDVKLNGTPEDVKVEEIDYLIPKEALGKTEKNSSIINSALVKYSFKKELSPGTTVWIMGTPKSDVSITLPEGFDAEKTEGLDNKTTEFESNLTVLKGNFSSEKNITLWLSENESFKAYLENVKEKEEQNRENKSMNRENKTESDKNLTDIRKSLGVLTNFLHSFT